MVGPFGLRPKGTMGRRALPMAKVLERWGHQVEVVLPPLGCAEDSGREWEEEGVQVRNIVLPRPVPLLREILITWRLLRRALAAQPEVVHCFKPKGYAGLAAAVVWLLRKLRLTNVRLVVDSDDWEGRGGWNEMVPYSWAQKRFFAWQERFGMKHCDALTLASKTLKGLAAQVGVERERVYYLPNGADVEPQMADRRLASSVRGRWELEDDPVMVLYTRFFEFEPQRVMQILGRVWCRVPSARLLVVGRGFQGEESRFLTCAQEAGLASRLAYAGWVQSHELPGYFAASDLAICPFEDTLLNRARCPAKLVDLMAAGLPIVADNVGQVGEYVEHLISGWLVPPGDVDAFAEGVVRLLRDPDLRTALGAKARRRITEEFGWDKLAEVLQRAYAT